MRISGNTIFIPGATSGIGEALAVALHDAGNTVVIAGRRQDRLDEIAARHPGIETARLDVADPEAIETVAADVLRRFPALDVVITMAGVADPEDLSTGDFLATAERIVTTNVLGTVRLVAAFTEHLAATPNATLVTVSSGLAFTPMSVTPTYSASKSFVHAFTDSLRIQLRDSGVRVRELVPPAVQTDIFAGQADADWAMPLDAFIAEVMELLEGDADEIVVDAARALRHSEVDGTRAELMDQLAHLVG